MKFERRPRAGGLKEPGPRPRPSEAGPAIRRVALRHGCRASRMRHRQLNRIAALVALVSASCAVDDRDFALEQQGLEPDASGVAGPSRELDAGDPLASTCSAGSVLTCWEAADGSSWGPEPGEILGDCRLGTRACDEGGVWGPCTGAVGPAEADACDVAGADNDCNGVPNEGCSCSGGDSRPCGTSMGACEPGTQTCVDGVWGACEGAIAAEALDSCAIERDDSDCNGVPNEGCACLAGQSEPCGDCGLRSCDPERRGWGPCVGQEQTRACWETPDGNAVTPERPATVSGNCRFGAQACGDDGYWAACEGAVGPQARDRCDVGGDDASCDGIPNEGCACVDGDVRACGTNTGNCQAGTQTCVAQVWGPCNGETPPLPFDSCAIAGDDANCNGSANDGCPCIGNQSRPCNDCGTQTCDPAARSFGPCVGDRTLSECVGNALTTCNGSGRFATTTCPFGCGAGGDTCAATCPPGQKPCNNSCIPNAQCCGGCSGNTPVCENGTCVARRNGEGCSRSAECASGFCRDGFCCNSACAGECESCASSTNRGTCVAVTTPRTGCAGSGTCGGRCDGINRTSCAYPDAATSCRVPACTGGTFMTSACNGNGACATSSVTCPFGCQAGGNACAPCRQKNGDNLLFNPGFDGSSAGWTLGGGNAYSSADVEGCSASGSILMTDFTSELSQCQNVTAGASYLFGFRFRAQMLGHLGYCNLIFYPSPGCNGSAVFDSGGEAAQVSPPASSWGDASGNATAPPNVASARLACTASVGFGNYDQFYLSRTTVGF